MAKVLGFKDKRLYHAQRFTAQVETGEFVVSGTLCGHLDFVVPIQSGTQTLCLSVEEAKELSAILSKGVDDVINNSRPFDDPRLYVRSTPAGWRNDRAEAAESELTQARKERDEAREELSEVMAIIAAPFLEVNALSTPDATEKGKEQ